MNAKIALLLLLCVSLALFGCAGRGRETTTQQEAGSGDVETGQPNGGASPQGSNRTSVDEQQLAGLFVIDTDKPLGDEGYGTQTPSQD